MLSIPKLTPAHPTMRRRTGAHDGEARPQIDATAGGRQENQQVSVAAGRA